MTPAPEEKPPQNFTEGVPLPYHARFTVEEFARLQKGSVPESMDDKWSIRWKKPHLDFHRSWTGEIVYRITLKATSEGGEASEALLARHRLAHVGPNTDYEAQLLDFLVSTLLLGQEKPFPRPSHVANAVPGLYQHAVAGTGHKEILVQTKVPQSPHSAKSPKPWWRFW